MTFVSKLALGAALAMTASLAATAPASAQRGNQKGNQQAPAAPAAAELKVSDEFRAAAAPAQATLDNKALDEATRAATADPQVKAAEALVKNDDEKYFAAWLRLRVEALRGNEAGQIPALETLIASPRTDPQQMQVYKRLVPYLKGSQLSDQKKYAEAIPLLLEARSMGSQQPDIAILLANAYNNTGKAAQVPAEVDLAIKASEAAGQKAPDTWYKFAIPRVKATGDRTQMAAWLTRYIQTYPTIENWRWAIKVYGQGAGATDKAERIALYRLMRATNALADAHDYIDYSYNAQQSGLPWEAVEVINEGRKRGKLPASDADATRTLAASQAAVKAEGSLEAQAKAAAAAANGRNALGTGDAFLASGNYARALELYDLSLQKGGVNADEVNLNRGVALRALGRKDEAKAAFQAVKAGSYANIALLWQTSIDFPPLTA